MQSELIAGDTLEFTKSVSGYPASEGWTLTYRLIPRSTGTALTFDAAADGDGYSISVASSTTLSWAAGEYSWIAYVHAGAERFTVERGFITVRPNLAASSGYDTRSHARIMLAQIEAALEALKLGTKSYSFGNRTMTKRDLPELLALRRQYQREVADEQADALGVPRGPLGRIRYGVAK